MFWSRSTLPGSCGSTRVEWRAKRAVTGMTSLLFFWRILSAPGVVGPFAPSAIICEHKKRVTRGGGARRKRAIYVNSRTRSCEPGARHDLQQTWLRRTQQVVHSRMQWTGVLTATITAAWQTLTLALTRGAFSAVMTFSMAQGNNISHSSSSRLLPL